MTPLETEANPNIRVGPLRWGRPVAFHGFRNAIKIWGQNSGCDRDLVDTYRQHGLKGLDRSTFLEQLNPHNTMFEHSVHSLGSSSK